MGTTLALSIRNRRMPLSGALFCALLAGCSAVPTPDSDGALEKFSASVNTLKTETSGTFDHITEASQKRFKESLLEELAEDDTYTLDKLAIETDLKTLSIKKAPYFLKLKMLDAKLTELNTALVQYVTLLAKLAHSDAISETTFDSLASNLNQGVLAASPNTSDTGKDDTKLFSLAAMSMTKNYLRTKQSDLLVNAIRQNQPAVNGFSTQLQNTVLIIAQAVNFEYLRETGKLKVQAAKPASRAAAIDQLITRNNKHFEDIQTLKRIHSNYGRLPQLHAEIGDMILEGNRGIPVMMRMLEATSKLKADYENTQLPSTPVISPVIPSTEPAATPVVPIS